MLISSEAMAKTISVREGENYKGTMYYGKCIDGVEYLYTSELLNNVMFPHLKPSGKPYLCN